MIFNRLIWKLRMWWYELEFSIVKYIDDRNDGPRRRAEQRKRNMNSFPKHYTEPIEGKMAQVVDSDTLDLRQIRTDFSSQEEADLFFMYLRLSDGTWDPKKSWRENYKANFADGLGELDVLARYKEKYKELVKKHNGSL